VSEAEDLAAKHLGLPPVGDLLTELEGLDDLARRRRVHEVIRLLAGASSEMQQAYRDEITKAKYFGRQDWRSALSEAKKATERERRDRVASTADYIAGEDGCLYLADEVSGTSILVARFIPQVIADIVRDDGAERTQVSRILVTLPNGRAGVAEVTPDRLRDASVWAVEAAGPAAVVMAITRADAHVRAAAQIFGQDHERAVIYAHTGWRLVDGSWRYLTASGALGASGLDTAVTVDLGSDGLNRYRLPDPGAAPEAELREAVRASLALRGAGPAGLAIPLLGAAYRAPLPVLPDGSVFAAGLTGLGKTTFAALIQQHFGEGLDAKHLPGSWTSTANSLEATAFALANTVFVIDDYNPQGSAREQSDMRRAADRVIRGIANTASRGRLRRDSTAQPSRPPRALVLATGEDVPPGHSLRARMTITEVDDEVITSIAASGAQKLAADGVYALAMAGYVRYLAGRYDELGDFPRDIKGILSAIRAELTREDQHRRIPEAIASLLAGWGVWLEYARAIGAITAKDQAEIYAEARERLLTVGAAQAGYQQDADPVLIYGRALAAAVVAGAAHLADSATGNAPRMGVSRAWGWTEVLTGQVVDLRPNGKCIGWVSPDGDVYLDSSSAYVAACEYAAKAGTPLAQGRVTIGKRLHKGGFLATTDGRDLQPKKDVLGGRRRVLHVRWDRLCGRETSCDT
jgi:hypothetical protein